MGVDVALENADGAELAPTVSDPTHAFKRSLPHPDDASFACLRFVDPFGDTTFNSLQIPLLIEELRRLQQGGDETLRSFLDEVIRLAEQALAAPHLYLKFYGD